MSIRNLFQNNPKFWNGNAIAWIMIDIDNITRYVIQNIYIYKDIFGLCFNETWSEQNNNIISWFMFSVTFY